MVSIKSAVMMGEIIALMLMLQVSCNDNKHTSSKNHKRVPRSHLIYYTYLEAQNWADSESKCRNNAFNTHRLVTLRSNAEKNALIQHILKYGQRNVGYWINTCTKESGLVCQSNCTEVSVNDQLLIEIRPRSAAPCSKKNLSICQEEEDDLL